MGTLNVSRAWSFRCVNEGLNITCTLQYMDKTHATIKVVKQELDNIPYGIDFFDCSDDVTESDKMLFINHVIINILLLEGTMKPLPFLYIRSSNTNLNFIKEYLSGGFPILRVL